VKSATPAAVSNAIQKKLVDHIAYVRTSPERPSNSHAIETGHASGKFVDARRTVAGETRVTEEVVTDASGLSAKTRFRGGSFPISNTDMAGPQWPPQLGSGLQ
jgi:hypothetical protein